MNVIILLSNKTGADGIANAAGKTVKRILDSRLGLVGLGRIGTAVAVRAKSFGFKSPLQLHSPKQEYDKRETV